MFIPDSKGQIILKGLLVSSNQSCSVSKETNDLTVTRGTLLSNNLFKSANIFILCSTKPVTLRSNVSLLTEQL